MKNIKQLRTYVCLQIMNEQQFTKEILGVKTQSEIMEMETMDMISLHRQILDVTGAMLDAANYATVEEYNNGN